MPGLKSLAKIMEATGNCKVPGCTNPITAFTGAGSDSLCESCQSKLAENGGFGRMGKWHTFHRNEICDFCGVDYSKHPTILAIKDEESRNRALRACMVGDHIVRRSDGGNDTADNVQNLCQICNAIKTSVEKDYRAGTKPK